MEGKTLRKRFQDDGGKRHEKRQQAVQDQSMTMEMKKSCWVTTMDRMSTNNSIQDVTVASFVNLAVSVAVARYRLGFGTYVVTL